MAMHGSRMIVLKSLEKYSIVLESLGEFSKCEIHVKAFIQYQNELIVVKC